MTVSRPNPSGSIRRLSLAQVELASARRLPSKVGRST